MANISKITLPDGASYDLRDNSKATVGVTQITIATNDWSNNQVIKTVNGVTSNNSIIVTYAPASREAYVTSSIYCSAQGQNSLTFICSTVPIQSVTINVMIVS